jgi:arsenite methyltransferase
MTETLQAVVDIDLRACCAALYESDWARLVLGDSFHPGGLALTERLGALLELGLDCRVLDLAAGKGTSAIFLAQHFGCRVVGLDYSAKNMAEAVAAAERAGVGEQVQFRQGDAEGLPFGDGEFDAVICECAFCTFPDKHAAAAEFARVLRPDGRVGLSDLTRAGQLPDELSSLFAWIACLADAQPVGQYTAYLEGAGFTTESVESHDITLQELVGDIRDKLLGAEFLVKLKKLDQRGIDFKQARQLARAAAQSLREGKLGYALIVGRK